MRWRMSASSREGGLAVSWDCGDADLAAHAGFVRECNREMLGSAVDSKEDDGLWDMEGSV